jgi:hypothetical protein
MIYSSKQTIDFTNTRQAVDIFYGRGGIPMKDGKYVVEVLCEGVEIGKADFTVR